MARKKRTEVKRLPIELDLSDPAQRRVWEYWLALSERGEASAWARGVLVRGVPVRQAEVKRDTHDTEGKPDVAPPAPKRTGSVMAQPKNPDLELPPNYLRKAGEVRKIPPFVGRKSGRSEDIEE